MRRRQRPRRAHIFAKAEGGWYQEPSWCSERLFAVERFPGKVWDPACGSGTVVAAAQAAGYEVLSSDRMRRMPRRRERQLNFSRFDFISDARPCRFLFSVVCNPPFDLVQEFCEQAQALGAAKWAVICLLRRLPAAHWLRGLPLRRVWLLTPRPSMPPGEWIQRGNKPGGGTQDFVWLVFEPGSSAAELGWLQRDGGSLT